jgi:riboflavin synthase
MTSNCLPLTPFTVRLTPHTREKTSLDLLGPGSSVNLEVDIVARYVLRFMEATGSSDAAWMDRLQKAGFVS